MAGQAQISSIESIEAFRAELLVYLNQMRPVIDEAASEVMRMRYWLQNEQYAYRENQASRLRRKLEEAQAELMNARLSSLQVSSSVQQLAVQKIKRALQEIEAKQVLLKKWDRDLENLTDPLVKQVNQLQNFLATDMTEAVVYLAQVIRALDAYRAVAAPGLSVTPAATTETDEKTTS